MSPRYVQVHPRDNVAIIVNPDGVSAGTAFPSGLAAREAVPQAHKITLSDVASGEAIMRYGQVIGHALRDIPAGSWVREDMLDLPTAPPLDSLSLATAVPAPLPPLESYTFEGYRNADGSTGTKNILGITTTVQCAAPTVDYAVRRIREEILPRFPNVDGVVAINHTYGCGMAVDAPGAAIPIQTLRHISQHANIGGSPLIVSLGCEKLQPARLLPDRQLQAFPTTLPILDSEPYVIRMQDDQLHGFGSIISAIMNAAEIGRAHV